MGGSFDFLSLMIQNPHYSIALGFLLQLLPSAKGEKAMSLNGLHNKRRMKKVAATGQSLELFKSQHPSQNPQTHITMKAKI